MIRKILLSTVLATTAATGLSMTALDASANPPLPHQDAWRHPHGYVRFEVLYRHGGHWDCFGTYRDRNDAERAAWNLRRQGHDVRVEREFVR